MQNPQYFKAVPTVLKTRRPNGASLPPPHHVETCRWHVSDSINMPYHPRVCGEHPVNSSSVQVMYGSSSPVRMGRALLHHVEHPFPLVCFNPRPSAWDGRSQALTRRCTRFLVSILARPHGTGALKALVLPAPKNAMFQSSPVRMGRALKNNENNQNHKQVSILARPHGTGARLSMIHNLQDIQFQSSPVRMGRALPDRQPANP